MKFAIAAPSRLLRLCFLLILLLFATVGTSCRNAEIPESQWPPCFVVAPGATHVRAIKFHGQDQLTYRIQSKYPADDVLGVIGKRLQALGWNPLQYDDLNPDMPSSHVRGFEYFMDATTQPNTSVQQWIGQWESSTHDIVDYVLLYRCPDNYCASTLDLNDLHVIAIYIPAKMRSKPK